MSSTSEMRAAWAPPCKGPFATMSLYGAGKITVHAKTVPAFNALNAILKKHDYKTRRSDTGAYNCRKITGGSNYSLHAYGIAADLNWQTNPYGPKLLTDMPMKMVEEIEALRTTSGHKVFRWGGRYAGNKDAMHYEIICTPAQLATGIKTAEAPKPAPKPTPKPVPKEEEVASEIITCEGKHVLIWDGFHENLSKADSDALAYMGKKRSSVPKNFMDIALRTSVDVQNINVAAWYAKAAADKLK